MSDDQKVHDIARQIAWMRAEIERLRAENIHLRRAGMDRPSAELHEAALAELRAEIARLRTEVLERARLLDMSAEREARLRARVEELWGKWSLVRREEARLLARVKVIEKLDKEGTP